MASSLNDVVHQVHELGFAMPLANEAVVDNARDRGVPERLLRLNQHANGLFIGNGGDFFAPNGHCFRFMIPPLDALQTVAEYGFATDVSPLIDSKRRWGWRP